eukprot:1683899-Rhodomonas_salina.2
MVELTGAGAGVLTGALCGRRATHGLVLVRCAEGLRTTSIRLPELARPPCHWQLSAAARAREGRA